MKMFKLAATCFLAVMTMCGLQTKTQAATNIVRVQGGTGSTAPLTFSPTNVTISPGDTITWTNVSASAHDVTPGIKTGPGTVATNLNWARINLAASQRGSVTFPNVGEFPYICVTHVTAAGSPNQTGLVSVVIANIKPVVTLTSPTNLSRFTSPASFTLTAEASDPDPDGSISNVQFFANTTLLGTVSTPPYNIEVSNLAGGWYQTTAVTTDNLGGSSTSSVANIFVTSNRTVVVSGFTFSPNLLSITVGDTVTFDGLGFFHTVTGSGTVEPFCGTTSPGASCAVTFNTVGSFPFHCVPHRGLGMTGSVQVLGPNFRPTARIASPANGSVFSTGSVFTASADASDLFGRVASVRFVRGGTANLGLDTDSPFSVGVSNQPAGNIVLTALVTDNTGLTSTSAPVNLTIINEALIDVQLSTPVLNVGGFQFSYTANRGLTYIVEGSENEGGPAPFVPLFTNTATTNLVTYTDSAATGRSNRAYRVRRAP